MVKIEIFGTGCENCRRLEANVRAAIGRLGIDAEIAKIEDFEVFIRRGITATPGMAIDDEIVSLGRVPSVEEIIEMLSGRSKEPAPHLENEIKVVSPSCGCSTTGTMIYACSGGSNVGQVSNEAAKLLVAKGKGKFGCLAGVGAHGESFVSNAKKAETVVVIDGCGSKCAFKTLRQADVEPSIRVVITDLGMKKDTSILETQDEDVKRVVSHIEKMV